MIYKTIIVFGLISVLLIGCKVNLPEKNSQINNADYWLLKTGSKIAYVRICESDSAYGTPVIFVHGGPGACQVKGSLDGRGIEWFRHLARLDFNIYLYDQVGSGLSARLTDPSEYTVARHVADLEEIRKLIGNKKVILIGESWGATLVSHYMAAYPENVAKVVFNSPGKINPSEWANHDVPKHCITSEFMDWIRETQDERTFKRFTDAESLILTNPKEAYKKLPDSFVDPLMDDFTSSIMHNTVYNENLVSEKTMPGMGWWSYTMTNFDAISLTKDKTLGLSHNLTPVLIMRGDADYLEPGIANQYKTTFSNSRFVNVKNAGHLIWLDRPEVYAGTIESFLLEKNFK